MTTLPPDTETDRRARTAHLAGFDGLRALAAFLVLVHHASFPSARMYTGHFAHQFTQLDIGVAIFFLLSGFLLFRPFVERSLDDTPGPNWRAYAWRRAARIFPAYWLALGTMIVVGKLTHDRLLGLPRYPTSLAGYLPYFGLVHVYRNLHEATGGINQAWTLAVEITFYVFLPIWAAAMARVCRGRSASDRVSLHLIGLVVLFGAGIAFRAWCSWGSVRVLHEVGEYWLPANLDLFALGMALAVLSVAAARGIGYGFLAARAGRLGLAWWLVACALFWWSATKLPVGITDRPTHLAGIFKQESHGLIAFCLLLPVVFAPTGSWLVHRLLEHRALVFGGTVSYGVYLWHQAWIIQGTRWSYTPPLHTSMPLLVAFALGASTATAAVSWFAVERPVIRWAARRSSTR